MHSNVRGGDHAHHTSLLVREDIRLDHALAATDRRDGGLEWRRQADRDSLQVDDVRLGEFLALRRPVQGGERSSMAPALVVDAVRLVVRRAVLCPAARDTCQSID